MVEDLDPIDRLAIQSAELQLETKAEVRESKGYLERTILVPIDNPLVAEGLEEGKEVNAERKKHPGKNLGSGHVKIFGRAMQGLASTPQAAADSDLKQIMEKFWAEIFTVCEEDILREEVQIFKVIRPKVSSKTTVAGKSLGEYAKGGDSHASCSFDRLRLPGGTDPICSGTGLGCDGWHSSQVKEGEGPGRHAVRPEEQCDVVSVASSEAVSIASWNSISSGFFSVPSTYEDFAAIENDFSGEDIWNQSEYESSATFGSRPPLREGNALPSNPLDCSQADDILDEYLDDESERLQPLAYSASCHEMPQGILFSGSRPLLREGNALPSNLDCSQAESDFFDEYHEDEPNEPCSQPPELSTRTDIPSDYLADVTCLSDRVRLQLIHKNIPGPPGLEHRQCSTIPTILSTGASTFFPNFGRPALKHNRDDKNNNERAKGSSTRLFGPQLPDRGSLPVAGGTDLASVQTASSSSGTSLGFSLGSSASALSLLLSSFPLFPLPHQGKASIISLGRPILLLLVKLPGVRTNIAIGAAAVFLVVVVVVVVVVVMFRLWWVKPNLSFRLRRPAHSSMMLRPPCMQGSMV